MSNLISLRHLHYSEDLDTVREIQMPSRIGRLTCLQTLEYFNIGRREEGRGIQELGTLQDLKGSLKIENLELVNGQDDAELANLSKKPNMYRLVLEWGNNDRESDKCDEDVLEGLEAHPNLKELHILKFMGDQFPQWFMNLTSLVELWMGDCTRCRKLPALGQLPSLQRLYLTGLENTTCIGLSFYSTSAEEDGGLGGSGTIGRQTFFPALKILSLASMKILEEWKDAHEVMDVFPVLEKLYIMDCPQLTTIPTPSRFPSLDVLEIRRNCHVLLVEKVLSNISTLSSLKLSGGCQRIESLNLVKGPESSLSINGCDSLPTDMLERLCLFPSLEVLEINKYCHASLIEKVLSNITTLSSLELRGGRQRIESLNLVKRSETSLSIDGCDSLPTDMLERLGLLPSLEVLEIYEYCHVSLVQKVLSNITTLSSLQLWGGESMESLNLMKRPESRLSINGCNSLSTGMLERLCLFPILQSVELRFCPNITTLRGMSCAACLKRLVVNRCVNLGELPEDLNQFQALKCLEIWCCPRINSFGLNPKKGQKGLLKSLEEFTIGRCDGLKSLLGEMFELCTSLRELSLLGCPDLVFFPLDLRRTPSLESFTLQRCPKLITEMPSGFGYLTSLRKVQIGPFTDDSVMKFDWSELASSSTLGHVSLRGMPDTKSLPHQLQDLTTITSLILECFGAIEALPDWLGNLASLEDLTLWGCEKLECLPSMAAIERLKLRRLQIHYCPLLTRRCTPQSGSEWLKISNIPERDIRYEPSF